MFRLVVLQWELSQNIFISEVIQLTSAVVTLVKQNELQLEIFKRLSCFFEQHDMLCIRKQPLACQVLILNLLDWIYKFAEVQMSITSECDIAKKGLVYLIIIILVTYIYNVVK